MKRDPSPAPSVSGMSRPERKALPPGTEAFYARPPDSPDFLINYADNHADNVEGFGFLRYSRFQEVI